MAPEAAESRVFFKPLGGLARPLAESLYKLSLGNRSPYKRCVGLPHPRLLRAPGKETGRGWFPIFVGKNPSAFKLLLKMAAKLAGGDGEQSTAAGAKLLEQLLLFEDSLINDDDNSVVKASLLSRQPGQLTQEWLGSHATMDTTNGVNINTSTFGLSADHSLTQGENCTAQGVDLTPLGLFYRDSHPIF